MEEVIKAFDKQPLVQVKDRKYVINPLTDHHPTTSYALIDDVVEELSMLTDFSKATKILGEEDRGGFLAVLMAYRHKLPFGLVKWNPSGLEGQFSIDFRNAYTHGKMYLHGIDKGDKVVLVEDMVDSGGTIISMVHLLREIGIELLDVVVVSVKEGFNGLENIKKETGVDVKYLVKFKAEDDAEVSEVTEVYNR